MFLSCCCRAQKDSSKKRKKSPASSSKSRLSSGDSVSPEPGYQPRARLVFSPHSPIFTIQSQSNNVQSSSLSSEDFYYYQDVYLHSKETLPRSRPPPSLGPRVSFTGVDQAVAAPFIDINLDTQETISPRTLPRTSVRHTSADTATGNGKIPSKIFASPENFKLSVRSLSQSSRSVISSSPEFMRIKDILDSPDVSLQRHKKSLSHLRIESVPFINCSEKSLNHFKQLSSYRYRLHNEHSVSSQCSSESTDSYKKSSSGENETGNKSFQSGLRRSHAFHTAELLQQQLLVDDEDQFLEEDEELSKSESLESLGQSSLGGQDRSQESPGPLPPGGGMSRSLRKSAAFHDRSSLEQQILDNERYQLEMRKKLLEEYVEHVYSIKTEHQSQLDRVEEIYKQNLDDLSDIVDGDVDAAVRNVRLRAESALENLKTRDGNGNNKGNCGNGSLLRDFLVRKESLPQTENVRDPQQIEEEVKSSMSGKLNKLQAYIDNKIGEIRKLNDQLRLVQLEIDQAEKEKENLKQLMDDLG